jgi:hypothetical protein
MKINKLKKDNNGLKQQMSSIMEDIVSSMTAKVQEFLTIDKNAKLMIDKV